MRAITLFFCSFLITQFSVASDWKIEKDKQDIIVETRKMEGQVFKSFRATTLLNGNMDEVIAFMEDVDNMINWSHNIIEAKYIKRHKPGHSHIYLAQKMPIVKNRDFSLEVTIEKLAEGKYQFLVNDDVDVAPLNKKYVRAPEFRGSYVFTQKSAGQIEVVYSATVVPGGSIPAWVANAAVVDIPFNTLKNMRKQDFSRYKGKNAFQL